MRSYSLQLKKKLWDPWVEAQEETEDLLAMRILRRNTPDTEGDQAEIAELQEKKNNNKQNILAKSQTVFDQDSEIRRS